MVLISDSMPQIHALLRSPESHDNSPLVRVVDTQRICISVIKCFELKDCTGNCPSKFIPQSYYFLATRNKIQSLITKEF